MKISIRYIISLILFLLSWIVVLYATSLTYVNLADAGSSNDMIDLEQARLNASIEHLKLLFILQGALATFMLIAVIYKNAIQKQKENSLTTILPTVMKENTIKYLIYFIFALGFLVYFYGLSMCTKINREFMPLLSSSMSKIWSQSMIVGMDRHILLFGLHFLISICLFATIKPSRRKS